MAQWKNHKERKVLFVIVILFDVGFGCFVPSLGHGG